MEPAVDFDHIVPRSRGGADLAARNVRGLCRSCHSRRTIGARGGYGVSAPTGSAPPSRAVGPEIGAPPMEAAGGR